MEAKILNAQEISVPAKLIGSVKRAGNFYAISPDSAFERAGKFDDESLDYGRRSLELIGLEAVPYLADSREWAIARLNLGEGMHRQKIVGDCIITAPDKPILVARKKIALMPSLIERAKRYHELVIEKRIKTDDYGNPKPSEEESPDILTSNEYENLERIAQEDRVRPITERSVLTIDKPASGFRERLHLHPNGELGTFLFREQLERINEAWGQEGDTFDFFPGIMDNGLINIGLIDITGPDLQIGKMPLYMIGEEFSCSPLLISQSDKPLEIKIKTPYFRKYLKIASEGCTSLVESEEQKRKIKQRRTEYTRKEEWKNQLMGTLGRSIYGSGLSEDELRWAQNENDRHNRY